MGLARGLQTLTVLLSLIIVITDISFTDSDDVPGLIAEIMGPRGRNMRRRRGQPASGIPAFPQSWRAGGYDRHRCRSAQPASPRLSVELIPAAAHSLDRCVLPSVPERKWRLWPRPE